MRGEWSLGLTVARTLTETIAANRHYLFRRSVFTDQFASCGVQANSRPESSVKQLLCGVANDSPWKFDGRFTLEAIDLGSGTATKLLQALPLNMSAAGASEWHDVTPPAPLPLASTVLLATITNSSGSVVHENLIPLASPEKMELPAANVTASVEGLSVTVATDRPALWVVLTTAAQGRFSDNAFLLRGSRTIEFIPFMPGQEKTLKATLRVEHVAQHTI